MSYVDKATAALKVIAIKTDIANLEDAIAAITSGGAVTKDYTINGKSVSRYSLRELHDHHAWLINKLNEFQAAADIAAGSGRNNKIIPQF